MITLKQMQSAAKEINALFGNEAINVKAKEDALKEQLIQAQELITPDDELTKGTQAVLDELTEKPAKKVATPAPAAKGKGKKAPEPVEEEEEEDEADEDSDEDEVDEDEEEEDDEDLEALKEEVEAADILKELKDIAADNEIFETLNKKIKSFKKVDDLKEAMSEVILTALGENTEDVSEDDEDEEEVEVISVKKGCKKEVVVAPATVAKGKAKAAPVKEEKVSARKGIVPNFKGTSTKERIDYLVPFIEKGDKTKKELIALVMKKFPETKEAGILTILTDCKNPKYNKFPKLVVMDAKGLYSFEQVVEKKKAKKVTQ